MKKQLLFTLILSLSTTLFGMDPNSMRWAISSSSSSSSSASSATPVSPARKTAAEALESLRKPRKSALRPNQKRTEAKSFTYNQNNNKTIPISPKRKPIQGDEAETDWRIRAAAYKLYIKEEHAQADALLAQIGETAAVFDYQDSDDETPHKDKRSRIDLEKLSVKAQLSELTEEEMEKLEALKAKDPELGNKSQSHQILRLLLHSDEVLLPWNAEEFSKMQAQREALEQQKSASENNFFADGYYALAIQKENMAIMAPLVEQAKRFLAQKSQQTQQP